jgi:hypothetical protein
MPEKLLIVQGKSYTRKLVLKGSDWCIILRIIESPKTQQF